MKVLRIESISWKFLLSNIAFMLIANCGTHVGNPEEESSASTPAKNKPRDVQERVVFALSHDSYDEAQSFSLYIDSLSLRITNASEDEDADNDDDLDGSNAWVSIPLDSTEPVDLLSFSAGEFFNFAGAKSIPHGSYSEIRLVLNKDRAATMTLEDGSEHLLKVPAGDESGIKIKETVVIDGQSNNLYVMNFDIKRSIIQLGNQSQDSRPGQGQAPENPGGNGRPNRSEDLTQANQDQAPTYLLKPIIRVVQEKESGVLSGDSPRGNVVCVYERIAEADASSECGDAIAIGRIKNGRYHLPFLPKGIYDLRIFDSEGNFEDVLAVEVDKKRVGANP